VGTRGTNHEVTRSRSSDSLVSNSTGDEGQLDDIVTKDGHLVLHLVVVLSQSSGVGPVATGPLEVGIGSYTDGVLTSSVTEGTGSTEATHKARGHRANTSIGSGPGGVAHTSEVGQSDSLGGGYSLACGDVDNTSVDVILGIDNSLGREAILGRHHTTVGVEGNCLTGHHNNPVLIVLVLKLDRQPSSGLEFIGWALTFRVLNIGNDVANVIPNLVARRVLIDAIKSHLVFLLRIKLLTGIPWAAQQG
jgi:hypothetical protein